MKRFLFLFILLPFNLFGQNNGDPAGARAAAMANAYTTQKDLWSIYHNQAGMAYLESPQAGVFYENKFLISELGYGGIAGAYNLGTGTIGVNYSNFGYDAYNQGKLGLAYGLKLSEGTALGAQINYHHVRISAEDYGQTNALTAELGFLVDVSSKISLGIHIFNVTRTKLNDFDDERIPTVLRFGAGYTISDEVMVTGEVEKDIDRDEVFKCGIEYRPVEVLYIRLGASSSPGLFAFGFGLNMGSFQLDLASTYHSVLGYSPQASLTFVPKKK